MVVKKLFVIPEEFYNSLMKRQKILDDPLLSEQVNLEQQKDAILRKPQNVDEKVAELVQVGHKQRIIEEQRKTMGVPVIDHPIISMPATEASLTPRKKRGRPAKNKPSTHFDVQIGSGKVVKKYANFLENFYMYEPKGRSMKELARISAM